MIEKVVSTGSEFNRGALTYRNSLGELAGHGKKPRTAEAVGPYVTEVVLLVFCGELWSSEARSYNGRARAAFVDAPIEKIGHNCTPKGRGQVSWDLAIRD